MDNNQPADISDEQLLSALKKAIDDFPPQHPDAEALNAREYSLALELRKARAVAALAREGWRPIPKDEGAAISLFERRSNPCPLVETAADAESQRLAKQLQELAGILESLQIPQWPGRVLRAAELLVQQHAPAPVLASEKPWERDGWLDQKGRCWMEHPGHEYMPACWQLCKPSDRIITRPRSLPHSALPVPVSTDASS